MQQFLKLFFCLSLMAGSYRCEAPADADDCVLTTPRLGFFAPLIFAPNGNLLTSSRIVTDLGASITIPANDHVVFSCAPNYFKKSTNVKSQRVTCKGGDRLLVNGVEKRWRKDLGCDLRNIEEIVKPVSGCPAGMETSVFGYENPVKEKSIVLGEACYSESEGRTLFVHTKLAGIENASGAHLRSEPLSYFNQMHPETRYKVEFLRATNYGTLQPSLRRKLAPSPAPEFEYMHLIRPPIVANYQLNSILKLGWNYFMNNPLPNWDRLMNDIAALNGENYDLYIGTHGVLNMLKSTGSSIEIYLSDDENKYPVAKYLWAVVKTENKAAAFGVYTNIRASHDDLHKDEICENKCRQMSWLKELTAQFEMVDQGKVWCCDIESFASKINEMPSTSDKYDLLV